MFYGLSNVLLAQESKNSDYKMQIEVGYTLMSNLFNDNDYFNFQTSRANYLNDETLAGPTIAFVHETKYPYIDLVLGTTFLLRTTTVWGGRIYSRKH